MYVTKKVVSAALLMCMVLIFVGSVAAMNGNQNGDIDREQLRDSSCFEYFDPVADKEQDMLQEQTREQLKDGSC